MRVFAECYPDEKVLRALGVRKDQLRHAARKGEVFNHLRDTPNAVGMVDEDPASVQPRDLSNYRETSSGEGLRLLTRQGKDGQKLIVVCPRLEEWLIQRAQASGIDPRQHHLPSDPKELHDIPRYEKKEGFATFLEELKDRDKGMRLLRRWLT